MNNKKFIGKIEELVRGKFEGESSGHDWWHTDRVRKLAIRIAEIENADRFVVEAGALLHDYVDPKFVEDVEEAFKKLKNKLLEFGIEEKKVNHVLKSIRNHGFRDFLKKDFDPSLMSLEARIISDADKIDGIGAVGIARCFAYNGKYGNLIYDPDLGIEENVSYEEYTNKKRKSHAINHFYEKLLKIKDILFTKAGRKIAQHRHDYLKGFLEEFFAEWEGER